MLRFAACRMTESCFDAPQSRGFEAASMMTIGAAIQHFDDTTTVTTSHRTVGVIVNP